MLSLYKEEDEVRTYGDLPHTSKLPKTTNDDRPSTSLASNISQIDGDQQFLHHGECDDDLSSAGSCVDILDEDVGSRRLDSIPISATRVLENLPTQRQSASTAKLDPAPAHIRDIFSSILGDLFHYMHRPKTPKDHEMNKTYFRHLADAFLIWDEGKMNEVRQTLREHGFSDKDIDLKLFYEPDFFRECVPRVAPPPSVMYWRVRKVFETFGNSVESKSKKPLFNDAAWKKANGVLREILAGYASDPPGVNFYQEKLDATGKPICNKYGLQIYTCCRGTNGVECVHKHIKAVFGAFRAGPKYSSTILREYRHQYNHRISQAKRRGFPCFGH
mmetsp:Transcript_630/g.1007  ORF Transcript_630/g.1007 Transcript_630/m.1007 type:complete len:331 (-) Transcript_630:328-1320(-)